MTTADVSVRPALPTDVAAIAAIQLASWRTVLGEEAAAALDPDHVTTTWAGAVRSATGRDRVLVAVAGPRVVGFVATTPGRRAAESGHSDHSGHPGHSVSDGGWTAEVLALEVVASDQRQGHGSRLLAAAADLAREGGAHHLAAWALRHDEPRVAFLTAAGFGEAGLRRELELPDGAREEILLTAVLGQS